MNDEPLLPAVEINTGPDPRHAVIWLHGLGADGNDFAPIVPELPLRPDRAIRFILPHASSIPVTLNDGFVMPAWYDILSMDLRSRADEKGVRASGRRIEALIERQNELGIPSERIILAGFSQGGAVAVFVGLRHAKRLGGVIALSTYLVCADSVQSEQASANERLPFFQAHGTFDPMVTFDRGEDLRERIAALHHPIDFHSFPMQHEVCMEEVVKIGEWINRTFDAVGD